MNKEFYKSRAFWTGVCGILTSVGMLLSGDTTLQSFIIEVIPGVLGTLGIIFRWNANTKLGVGKK